MKRAPSIVQTDLGLAVVPAHDGHVAGIDALRFVAAIWVVLSHTGTVPISTYAPPGTFVELIVRGISGALHCGPAAVIVFFIISGFCIHYPYAAGAAFDARSYLIRRYVRIGVPVLAALGGARFIGVPIDGFSAAILWSLVAEVLYYTAYPIIRRVMLVCRLRALILFAYAVSILIVATHGSLSGYAVYGWSLNWLVGLPCWLLGVDLAEHWKTKLFPAAWLAESRGRIWKWRLSIWALSSLCLVLNFHSALPYGWTLNAFAPFAYVWLATEMLRAAHTMKPWSILERGGRWSYSLYLCHMLAASLYSICSVSLDVPLLDWALRVGFILAASYVFFIVVERPAHALARKSANAVASVVGAAAMRQSL